MIAELLPTIAKLRRDMPRNSGVMSVCDELERLLTLKPIPLTEASVVAVMPDTDAAAALERLRSTKRKAQKKWYHSAKDRRRAETVANKAHSK